MAPAHPPIKKAKKTRFLETVAMCSLHGGCTLEAAIWAIPGIAKTTNHDTRSNTTAAHPPHPLNRIISSHNILHGPSLTGTPTP